MSYSLKSSQTRKVHKISRFEAHFNSFTSYKTSNTISNSRQVNLIINYFERVSTLVVLYPFTNLVCINFRANSINVGLTTITVFGNHCLCYKPRLSRPKLRNITHI